MDNLLFECYIVEFLTNINIVKKHKIFSNFLCAIHNPVSYFTNTIVLLEKHKISMRLYYCIKLLIQFSYIEHVFVFWTDSNGCSKKVSFLYIYSKIHMPCSWTYEHMSIHSYVIKKEHMFSGRPEHAFVSCETNKQNKI